MKTVIPLALSIIAHVAASLQAAPIPGLYNTGKGVFGAPLADNQRDFHYTYTPWNNPCFGCPFPTVVAPTSNTEGPGAANGSANYYYETKFSLAGMDPATAEVHGQWSTDNAGKDILINGSSTGQANPAQFTSWTPFRITNGFVAGVNTLTFVVNNGAGEINPDGPTGLRVEMSGSAVRGDRIGDLYNTGVDTAGSPLSDDALDGHYLLSGASPMLGVPFVATSAGGFPIGPWLGDNSTSAWIAPTNTTVGPNGTTYFYQTHFNLLGVNPVTAQIHGRWSSDNDGADVLINGVSTGQKNPSQFASWTPFHITSGFVMGNNTLTFVVNNGFGEAELSGPTGLRVEMTGTVDPGCIDFRNEMLGGRPKSASCTSG